MFSNAASLPLVALLWATASLDVAAFPSGVGPQATSGIVSVRLVCDRHRCLDSRTGAYTESNCDYRGCWPSSGVVGYLDGRGRTYGYQRTGRWECNRSRCRDSRTGAYTESTCDRRGCRPSSGVLGYTD